MSRRDILALGAAGLLSTAAYGCWGAPLARERPNIIVFLADALRADFLPCYGFNFPTAPHVTAFADDSYVFDQCYAQAPWTKPSIASLFTGVLPPVHQAVLSTWGDLDFEATPIQKLRPDFTTLAEALQAVGYHTAYFCSNPHVREEYGFARGFDFYRYEPNQKPKPAIDQVLSRIVHHARQPFFLFIHLMDPHGPYRPTNRLFKEITGKGKEEAFVSLPEKDQELLMDFRTLYRRQYEGEDAQRPPLEELSKAGRVHLKRLYGGEILGVDEQFGRLIRFLERQELLEHSVVAFISDHGEAFGEHEMFGHGNSLFIEELRTPLAIHVGGRTTGERVPHTVSLYDLYPTLLGLAGATLPSYIQAQSLLRPDGVLSVHKDRPVSSYCDFSEEDMSRWHVALSQGGHKVIRQQEDGPVHFYNHARDPREWHGSPVRCSKGKSMLAKLERIEAANAKLSAAFGEPEWTLPPADAAEQLEALGYL
jgi:choline-sulfatase